MDFMIAEDIIKIASTRTCTIIVRTHTLVRVNIYCMYVCIIRSRDLISSQSFFTHFDTN